MKKRRGLSPVIATVLLIAIVIAIALIIFLWVSGTVGPAITKFNGKNIELVCQEDVSFGASYSGGKLQIVNEGNTPIFGMKIQEISGGSHDTVDVSTYGAEPNKWPADGLKQADAVSITEIFENVDELLLIPVLLGNSEDGEKSYVCDERYGVEVDLS